MKSHFIAFIILCLISVKISAQQKHVKNSKEKTEDLVMKKVSEVPEVKEFLAANRPSAQSHRGLLVDDEPNGKLKYYVVKMGYDDYMFRTVCRFCVDPHTMKVYYWDVMADDVGFSYSAIIPLEKWRKLRKTVAWQKPHTYKAGNLVALTN